MQYTIGTRQILPFLNPLRAISIMKLYNSQLWIIYFKGSYFSPIPTCFPTTILSFWPNGSMYQGLMENFLNTIQYNLSFWIGFFVVLTHSRNCSLFAFCPACYFLSSIYLPIVNYTAFLSFLSFLIHLDAGRSCVAIRIIIIHTNIALK